MKNIKTREDFVSSLTTVTPLNERAMAISVDAEDTKHAEESIKKLGGKITKVHGFGVIDIMADPKLVDDIKKIEDVTNVLEITAEDKKEASK